MKQPSLSSSLSRTVRWGLIAGVIALSICMIGLIESFDGRNILSEQPYSLGELLSLTGDTSKDATSLLWKPIKLTLGQIFLFSAAPIVGYLVAQSEKSAWRRLLNGLLAGALVAVPIAGLVWLSHAWEGIREAFLNVSPTLIEIITLGRENLWAGVGRLSLMFAILGVIGALFSFLPKRLRAAILTGFGWAVLVGAMSEIFIGILRPRITSETMKMLFGKSGINLWPFLIVFITTMLFNLFWRTVGRTGYRNLQNNLPRGPKKAVNWTAILLFSLLLLILPSILGRYLSEIFNNVGLYILMGLGLNIAVGLAGLLDLGYVTNFAVGAYLMALLTSGSDYGLADPISFWVALPICVLAAMLTGFIFALPVLKMRGDYLAIATLGFGEIIRVLAQSDALKSFIGGAQGILRIPKPQIPGRLVGEIITPINYFLETNATISWLKLSILKVEDGLLIFDKPIQLYYLIILACLLMLFVSRRLNNSRVGRKWMAIREDEDVAAAMGINTTNAKVIAFTLSAASGGLAGAIFAAKLGSIYPHSFQLLISINVLSLIIVGGIGSIPGVVIGAFALVGIPEFLREFSEFRILFYGIALIAMMLVRPEGLWPSDVRRRELRDSENESEIDLPVPVGGD